MFEQRPADLKLTLGWCWRVAQDNFSVASPLSDMTKDEVREVSRELGLPNWNFAASPCLRSRLALNVEATANHLAAVETAEEIVRKKLELTPSDNLRVRMVCQPASPTTSFSCSHQTFALYH